MSNVPSAYVSRFPLPDYDDSFGSMSSTHTVETVIDTQCPPADVTSFANGKVLGDMSPADGKAEWIMSPTVYDGAAADREPSDDFPRLSSPTSDTVNIEAQASKRALQNNTYAACFIDSKIRHAFIKKVYAILFVQLAITVGFICLFIFCIPVKVWVQNNSWFYWTSYAVFLISYIMISVCAKARRRVPINYICLLILTLALSYMAGTISSYYNTSMVLIMMGITCFVSVAISIFAIQTKFDFTMRSGLLLVIICILFLAGLGFLIAYLITGDLIYDWLWGGLLSLIFCLILLFDTQRIVGGKNRRVQISPEEYITGALHLYCDIVFIFLH